MMRRSSYPDNFWLTVALFIIVFSIAAVYNEAVYHDWTCMFAKCVKVKY